jgi:hypothetical protein
MHAGDKSREWLTESEVSSQQKGLVAFKCDTNERPYQLNFFAVRNSRGRVSLPSRRDNIFFGLGPIIFRLAPCRSAACQAKLLKLRQYEQGIEPYLARLSQLNARHEPEPSAMNTFLTGGRISGVA